MASTIYNLSIANFVFLFVLCIFILLTMFFPLSPWRTWTMGAMALFWVASLFMNVGVYVEAKKENMTK